jgi:cell division protein FtsI (penicillin-binding protein 3)
MATGIKKSIFLRYFGLFASIVVLAGCVAVRLVWIQQVQGDIWRKKANKFSVDTLNVQAVRGNIYAEDGSLLATSVPKYYVAFDATVSSKNQKNKDTFRKYKDDLYEALSIILHEKFPGEYRSMIEQARKDGDQYLMLSNSKIDYQQKKTLEKRSYLFRNKFYGGGIFTRVEERSKPFGDVAARTIGVYKQKDTTGAGIEFSFNKQLAGKDGKGTFERLATKNGDKIWRSIGDDSEAKPEAGMDVYTTIDMNIQDVAEASLRAALQKFNAAYGCVVVMHTQTGFIKAMVNLKKIADSTYRENDINYAISDRTDPGSIFKLPTMVALLEEADIPLNTLIQTGNGNIHYQGKDFTDDHPAGDITVQQVMEKSSNVGVFKLMQKYFFNQPERYTDFYLKQKFKLNERMGFQLRGEPKPLVKSAFDSRAGWSKISLPQMAVGYELGITPLQMLAFYNAIANDGYWVKPLIVKQVRNSDEIIEDFSDLNQKARDQEPICKESTVAKVKQMLEGVVKNGTARGIYTTNYRIAGKTGTAVKAVNGRFLETGPRTYHTSFVGFFPAEAPKYTIIVVVDSPSIHGVSLMAAEAPAPVFRDIADKIFATDITMHKPSKVKTLTANIISKHLKNTHPDDATKIAEGLDVETDKIIGWTGTSQDKNKVPDVRGKTLRDALAELENKGFRVSHTGRGKVKTQSLPAGVFAYRNKIIDLALE